MLAFMDNNKEQTAAQYAMTKGVCQATVYRWIQLGLPCRLKSTGKALRPYIRLIDVDQAEAWLQERASGKGVEA